MAWAASPSILLTILTASSAQPPHSSQLFWCAVAGRPPSRSVKRRRPGRDRAPNAPRVSNGPRWFWGVDGIRWAWCTATGLAAFRVWRNKLCLTGKERWVRLGQGGSDCGLGSGTAVRKAPKPPKRGTIVSCAETDVGRRSMKSNAFEDASGPPPRTSVSLLILSLAPLEKACSKNCTN